MKPQRGVGDPKLSSQDIRGELHDMCQPLTVLRCRLELGLLFGEPAAMKEALLDSLAACLRLSGAVERMRSLVEQIDEQKEAREVKGGRL